MNPHQSFEELMHQVNDLLQLVADNIDKPLNAKLPNDIESKLGALERQVETFRRMGKAYMAQLGVTDEDVEAILRQTEEGPGKENKKINDRTIQLKKEIECKMALLETVGSVEVRAPTQDISISEQKQQKSQSSTVRKNLFKRVGGNKNWRPL